MESIQWQAVMVNGLDEHNANFVEAIKTRNEDWLNCSIQEGAKAAINAHLGNIANRTGEKIEINDDGRFFKQ